MHTLTLSEAPPATVDELESAMLACDAQIDVPTLHHFSAGIYAREVRIPAGTLLTGKIHRTRHLNILSAGSITVWTEATGLRRLEAPCTFLAEPGTRRVGYAHTDVVWTTVHGTTLTDLDALEAALIMTPAEYAEHMEQAAHTERTPETLEALCRGSE